MLRLLGKDIDFSKSHLASLCTRTTDSTESSHAVIQQLLGGSAHSWGLSLQTAAGLVIFHISIGSSGLKGYTIPLISIHKGIKLPYYQCRKTKKIITEIKNVLVRYFIKGCLHRHVYLRLLRWWTSQKIKTHVGVCVRHISKNTTLKITVFNYHWLQVQKSCLVTIFLSVATKFKLCF